ncbi:copper homeostasis periplasmic binding protein CopC [Massilia jejuensis]|uniref:Copper homeostasis periplasmic binding protein CopC n=1 Tax=Massilia jejuensis TaxID=648894 RepID=A0ABW0PCF7_9BURK
MKAKYILAAGVAALGCAFAAPALAHAKLEVSTPAANAVVSPAPSQLRLQFSEPLELPFSKVKLVDEQGVVTQASKLAIDSANAKVLVAAVPALRSGAYRVQWTTITRDGHKVKGEFGFRVK